MLFVEEEAGQLFRDIALAISAAVGLSLLVSITVIPTAAAAILRDDSSESAPAQSGSHGNGQPGDGAVRTNGEHATPPSPTATKTARSSGLGKALHLPGRVLKGVILRPADALGGGFVKAVVGINAWAQRGILRQVVMVVGFVGASIVLSYLMMPKVEYLPTGNRNLVLGILLPPPGYNIDQLKEMGEQIENELKPYWDVDINDPKVAANLKYPPISDFFYVARGRQLFMGLRSADPLRAGELVPLVQEVASKIPGTIAVAKQSSLFEQGLTAGRTIDVEVVGPELETLVGLGGRILGQVKGQLIPKAQVRPVPSLDLSSPEVHVVLKPEQAEDMGIDATQLGYIVDALVDGAYASDYYSGGDKIDLTIIGQQRFANRTQDLASLAVATPTGNLVQLEALARVSLSSGPEQINHRERQRAITIEVSPPPEVPLEDAMELIGSKIVKPLREGGELGSSYQINLAGTADKLTATWNALRFNIVLALLITYLLMAALFESWLYPLVIIFSVPLGAVGGFAGLWLLNRFLLQPLDVLTMLGFVILIGTVVNNPILIVHQSLNHIREDGMSPSQAILESVRTRIRPIFMTTSTTVLGLMPLVLFPGAGSELYRGLGSVMLGGLIVSTVFTLVLVPTLFSLALKTKNGVARLFGFRVTEESEVAGTVAPKPHEPVAVS